MPRPTSATTLQRADLGALAYEYMMDAPDRGFIGMQIMPVFEVVEQSADYPIIPIEALLKLQDTKRAPRTNYNRGDYEFETSTYSCEEHGWEEPVDDVERKLYRRYFDAEEVATKRATDILLRNQEVRVQTIVQSTSVITNTAAVTTEWSTSASCTPKSDVKTAKRALKAATGIVANVGICSEKVFENVMMSAELKSYLQYTNPHLIETREAQRRLMALYLDLEDILIGGSQYDSAKKGQSFTLADIWDDEYFTLARISRGGNNLREPVLGRTMLWTADSPEIIVTEQYREEAIRSDIYRVRQYVDEAVIFSGAGYILSNITA
jgi:hypothetical protein